MIFKNIFQLQLLLSFLIFLTSCSDPDISLVQDGEFNSCSGITVGEMADAYLSTPNWESIVADDGRTYVNLRGGMTYDSEPANALIQFKIRGDEFMVNAVEMDDEPLEEYVIEILISEMCEEAF